MRVEPPAETDESPQPIAGEPQGQLAGTEELLQSVSDHPADASAIAQMNREQDYTLKDADHAYRVILEAINEGTATLGADGAIFYCNPAFAALLELPLGEIIGSSLQKFVMGEDLSTYRALIEQGATGSSKGEMVFRSTGGKLIPVLLSCSSLRLEGRESICLVATDLTEQKRQLEEKKQAELTLREVRHLLNQSQETERLLLARELHDGPLQEVIGMTFDLLLLAQTLSDTEQIAKVNSLTASVQKTARQLRLMAQTLRPPVLVHLGLAAAVRAHLKRVQETREKPLLSFTTSEETWTMPEETALALLRITQQAVQNALQHAKAERIDVSLHYDKDCLRLEVKDDGCGFKKAYNRIEFARDGHLGVVGMAERTEAIRGNFEVSSQPNHGTSIRVTLPKPTKDVSSMLEAKSDK